MLTAVLAKRGRGRATHSASPSLAPLHTNSVGHKPSTGASSDRTPKPKPEPEWEKGDVTKPKRNHYETIGTVLNSEVVTEPTWRNDEVTGEKWSNAYAARSNLNTDDVTISTLDGSHVTGPVRNTGDVTGHLRLPVYYKRPELSEGEDQPFCTSFISGDNREIDNNRSMIMEKQRF